MTTTSFNPKPLMDMIALYPHSQMFQKARELLNSISCTCFERMAAHIKIDKADPRHNFSGSKKFFTIHMLNPDSVTANDRTIQKRLYSMIEKSELMFNSFLTKFPEYTIADSIIYPFKDSLIEMISLNPSPQMIQHAKDFANSIEFDCDKIDAHIAIAKIDAQHDFSRAKECAFYSSKVNFFLLNIVEAQACFNLDAAKATASNINDLDSFIKELAYLHIIEIEAQTDIEAAKKTRDMTIKDRLRIDCANKYIAINLAKKDLPAAKAIAALIDDDFHRQAALSAIEAQQTT